MHIYAEGMTAALGAVLPAPVVLGVLWQLQRVHLVSRE
jgi:hypothetical protein